MPKIEFVDGTERRFTSLRERARTDPVLAAKLARQDPGVADIERFVHHAGSDDAPELFEVRLPPGATVEPHAHEDDEIIVISAGEAIFGKQHFGVGSSVFVPRMTLYSFQAGPDGLTFLNFRGRRSPGGLLKDEFVARRATRDATS